MDSPSKREKLKATKEAKKRGTYPPSAAPPENENVLFPQRNGAQGEYTPKWQTYKPYKAVETRTVVVPSCTLVSGQNDPSTGGEGGDPD